MDGPVPSGPSELGVLFRKCYRNPDEAPALLEAYTQDAERLNSFGDNFSAQFNENEDHQSIALALAAYHLAAKFVPKESVNYSGVLHNIGWAHMRRFEVFENMADIDPAIEYLELSLAATPRVADILAKKVEIDEDNEDLHVRFANLAYAYKSRYWTGKDPEDLAKEIIYRQNAVDVAPEDLPSIGSYYTHLGNSLSDRYDIDQSLDDLDRAIVNFDKAIELTNPDHRKFAFRLNQLGACLGSRYEALERQEDLSRSLDILKKVVELTPEDDHNLAGRLNNLGATHHDMYRILCKQEDADQAIECLQKSVDLTPPEDEAYATRLNGLGTAFGTRFKLLGDLEDVSRAILYAQRAIEVYPEPPHYPFVSLGSSFLARYRRAKDPTDLEQAIACHIKGWELIPDDLPALERQRYRHNLGSCYIEKSEYSHDIVDVDTGLKYIQESLDIGTTGGPNYAVCLANFGLGLERKFRITGKVEDIDSAINHLQRAVDGTPEGLLALPMHLGNLGYALRMRCDETQSLEDIDRAIECSRRAVSLCPPRTAALASSLLTHGRSVFKRYLLTKDENDLTDSLAILSQSANDPQGSPFQRLYASRDWATNARNHRPDQVIQSFTVALRLLAQTAGLEQTIYNRHITLKSVYDLGGEAAMAALQIGRPDVAIEWLEQGRCLVWNQLKQLRAPVDDLELQHPELASQFREIARAVEGSGSRTVQQIIEYDTVTSTKVVMEEETRRHLQLAQEYSKLLRQIRELEGFEGFHMPPRGTDFLGTLPPDSTIVLLNAHEEQCDAIALVSGYDHPIHIPLPDLTYDVATEMSDRLYITLGFGTGSNRAGKKERERPTAGSEDEEGEGPEERYGKGRKRKRSEPILGAVLRELWYTIAEPVLTKLGYITTRRDKRKRIWWCPTGPLVFLPIHAAGLYDSKPQDCGGCVSDYVISSYTPTVRSLLDNFKASTPKKMASPNVLIVSQPATPSLSKLPFVEQETTELRSALASNGLMTLLLEGDQATRASVTAGMQTHSWIHLACHGIQDERQPLKSGVHLHDGRLELMELIRQELPRTDFAFLSACQTSTGDVLLSEEVVHLAAGMLAVGYRGVVGTMWSIVDQHGPGVSKAFYAYLAERKMKDGMDSTSAAYALDQSIRKLREDVGDTELGLLAWVPYVHFGY